MAMGWQQPIKVSAVAITTARTAIAVANQTATWTDLGQVSLLEETSLQVARSLQAQLAKPLSVGDWTWML
jgi:hypothetical protein